MGCVDKSQRKENLGGGFVWEKKLRGSFDPLVVTSFLQGPAMGPFLLRWFLVVVALSTLA
jgi:hypothetical protein